MGRRTNRPQSASGCAGITLAIAAFWLVSAFFDVQRTLGRGGSVSLGFGRLYLSLPMARRATSRVGESQPAPWMAIPAGTWTYEFAWPLGRKHWVGELQLKGGNDRYADGWIVPPNPRLALLPEITSSANWPLRLTVPLWVFGLPPAVCWRFAIARTRSRIRTGRCLACGYDLQGTKRGIPCPECGSISR